MSIPCTRSRPYHKNDQAWVEQKNGSVVRRLVGYRRLEGLAAAAALSRLYAASRLFVNFFQPSFKLASKTRVGAKVRKTYHAPETPYAKLLACAAITDEMKDRLRAVADQLDPLRLLEEIRIGATPLGRAGRWPDDASSTARHEGNLDGFLAGLGHGVATRRGPRHPSPRAQAARVIGGHAWIRSSSVWPCVRTWLEAEPDRIGRELFVRLQGELPGVFPDGQLRTFQRRVRDWRQAAARQLVFASPSKDAA